MSLNLGARLGYGTTSDFGSNYSCGYGNSYLSATRNATSTNINTISRNAVQGHSKQFAEIIDCIEEGDIKGAMEIYEQVKTEEKSKSYNFNIQDSEIESAVETAFKSSTGYSFLEAVEENTHSSFISGLSQGIFGFGLLADSKSTAEAKADAKGKNVKAGEMFAEGIGGAVGGALSGAAAATGLALTMGVGAGGAIGLAAAGAALTNPVGWAIIGVGALVGLAQVIGKNITDNK